MSDQVTVVIPLYNKVSQIRRAINSVLKQTYSDFELLVVDDGSTDDGAAYVEGFMDARIHLIRQENSGVSAARNRGIAEAKTELIAFLDADDEYCPEFLSQSISAMNSDLAISVVFSNFAIFSTREPRLHSTSNAGVVDNYFDFWLSNERMGISSSGVLIRKHSLNQVGDFPIHIASGQDTDTWFRLAWSGVIYYIPEVLSYYHTEINDSVSKSWRKSLQVSPTIQTFYDWRDNGRIPQHLLRSSRKCVQFLQILYAERLIITDRRTEALRALWKIGIALDGNILHHIMSGYARAVMPTYLVAYIRTIKKCIRLITNRRGL